MKKVGVITLYGLFNYGNRLQNYAVHSVLKSLGVKATSYTCEKNNIPVTWKTRLRWQVHEFSNYRFSGNRNAWKLGICRHMAFLRFTEKYIPTIQLEQLDGLHKQADYFLVGSDQVWNPLWYEHNHKELYLLSFAKPEQKVCFSPSFGIEALPTEWVPWFRENLKTFPSISVREHAGADIVEDLIGVRPTVLIDPTLMLEPSDWLHIAKKPKNVDVKKPFILTYFLGDRPAHVDEQIRKIQLETKAEVYHLLDKSQPDVYASGPSEFLYLISKADIVLTDSFHACVFSFLFDRPFVVYDREEKGCPEMTSRLESFLTLFSLERKHWNPGLENDLFENDYTAGKEVLTRERERAISYLKAALRIGLG